MFTLSRAD